MKKQHSTDIVRRRLVQAGALSVVAVPLSGLLASRPSVAQEKIEESDPTAQSLNYVHDASAVDNPARQDGAVCTNCQLYQGAESDEWAPCAIFQNKLVKGTGWCTAWVAKAG